MLDEYSGLLVSGGIQCWMTFKKFVMWTGATCSLAAAVSGCAGPDQLNDAAHSDEAGGEHSSSAEFARRSLDVLECTTAAIPAQLEAEEYCSFDDSNAANNGAANSPECDRGDSVDLQVTTDDHGSDNCNVGWTTPGEFLDYQLTSPGGEFEIVLRGSSNTSGRELAVALDGVELGSVTFNGTGWQSFQDLSVGTFQIPPGAHDLRVTFVNGNTNLNHLEFVLVGDSGDACSNGSAPLLVEAEDYCLANESTPDANNGANNAPQCDRGDGVDIEATQDGEAPNCNIGWTTAGEYWEYNVGSSGGAFDVVVRAASNVADTSLEVSVDGAVVGVAEVSADGWQSFADYSVGTTVLSSGSHTVRVTSLTGNTNFNHFELASVSGPGDACSNGTAPRLVEAEDYCSANESTPDNNRGDAQCGRDDGVDIQETQDGETPNCNIGWTTAGEYWEYNVGSSGGAFDVVVRAASNVADTSLEVSVDGAVIGVAEVSADGWQLFANYNVGTAFLSPGSHTVRVTSLTGNTNFNHFELVSTGPSCADEIQNQNETAVDCGGACNGCGVGDACSSDSDCSSQRCVGNTCAALPSATRFTAGYYAGTAFGQLLAATNAPVIDFDYGTGAPFEGVPENNFSVRWTGVIVPEFSESYTFHATSDDGVRLLINDVEVIDDLTIHASQEVTGALQLVAGQSYELTLEYFDAGGPASVALEWSSPSLSRRLVRPSVANATGLSALEPFEPFLGGSLPSNTPGQSTGATFEDVTGDLDLGLLLTMERAPDSNLMYVGSRDGRMVTVNPATGASSAFLDISNRVWTGQDSGLLGLAFHPEFGQPGSSNGDFFYLYYVTRFGGDEFIRLSRFERNEGQSTANPSSEFVLIQQRLGPTLHRGGGLLFGNDGLLYLSIGDLGWPERTQSITDIFVGGVLRIDVDQDPMSSHPIVTELQPNDADSFNRGYFIPDSNPWVGESGALEEFYAVGSRNPHRMSVDRVTGRILIGNVGSNPSDGLPTTHEEINELSAGANFGWPFREASEDFAPRPSPLLGTVVDPNYVYPRSTGGCIIGGHVYRGSALPQLFGRYIVGDCTNNLVWAMSDDAGNGPAELLFTAPASPVTAFGIDQEGEVYVGGGGSTVYRLAPSGPSVAEPPLLLSQTGAFADLATLEPAPGFIPYGMNNPLWSDGSLKRRWVGVPNDGNANTPGEKITASATGDWTFPEGTVFMKHFELAQSDGSIRRLETRFMANGEDGRYWGVTYRWFPDGSDAELLTEGLDEVVDGQVWHYPSRQECLQCHNTTANEVLGPRTAQLNRPYYYSETGTTANQISTFQSLGLFESPLGNPDALPKAVSNHTLSATLEARVKSYLSSNCAHCHRPGGQGRGVFDTQFDTPLQSANIVNGGLADELGIPNARVVSPQDLGASVMHERLSLLGGAAMPPLAKNVVDEEALELFQAWVAAVNDGPGASAPSAQSQSVTVGSSSAAVTLSGSDADGDALDFAVTVMPEHGTLTGFGANLTYLPNAGYAGQDSFEYVAYDGARFSGTATVSLNVSP